MERFWDGDSWTDAWRSTERLSWTDPSAPSDIVEPDLVRPTPLTAIPIGSTVGFELPSTEDVGGTDADIDAGARAVVGSAQSTGRNPRRTALTLLSAALAAIVIAGGCFLAVGRNADADAAVADAVSSALTSHSADMTISGSGSAAGALFSMTGSGVMDFTNNALQMQMTVSEGSQQMTEQAIYLNKVAYVSLGSEISRIVPGKSWVSLDLSQLSSGSGTGSLGSGESLGSDPSTALRALSQEGNTANDLGPSTVDGVAVQGYAVHLDGATVEKELAGEQLPPWMQQAMKSVTNPDVDYRVYVNGAGQLARLTTSVTESVNGQGVAESVMLDFSHYGAPISVSAPPSDQVIPFQTFLKDALSLATPPGSLN
jgi:hypothetical protein